MPNIRKILLYYGKLMEIGREPFESQDKCEELHEVDRSYKKESRRDATTNALACFVITFVVETKKAFYLL